MTSQALHPTDDDGLIFQWERKTRLRWRLAFMLAFSLLLHAASFYVIQVAYTPTGSQLPPPAQVTMVPLDRPEYAPLARWLAMTDPALLLHPSAPTPGQVLDSIGFQYVPSYDAAPPPFKPLEAPTDPLAVAPPRPRLPGPAPTPPVLSPMVTGPEPVPATALSSGNKPAASRSDVPPTQIQFSDELTAQIPRPLPGVNFRVGPGAKVLNPTVYLVGIPPNGGEPFLFRQSSSGEASADAYARSYLAAVHFRSTAEPKAETVWGWATFYWSGGVYHSGQ